MMVSAVIISMALPSFATQEAYPQLDIGGYKRWLYGKIHIDPNRNYSLALEDRLLSTSPWTEELNLLIDGKLSEDLSVYYDLRQFPNLSERYDVMLNYKDYSLVFGFPKEIYSQQDYLFHDYYNGISAGGKWDSWRILLFSGGDPKGQYASTLPNFSSYKLFRNPDYTGDTASGFYYRDNPYNEYLGIDLKRSDIRRESVEVYLDNRKLAKNSEYYFDESAGLVLVRSSFKNAAEARISYVIGGGSEESKVFGFSKVAKRRAFLSPEFRIIEGSEIVTVDGIRLTRDLDYRINYNLGLFIMDEPLRDDAEVRIDYNYSYGANLYASETISGQAGTTFDLAHKNIVGKSETITKNNVTITNGYLMDYKNGKITFAIPLTLADTVIISYSYTGIRQEVMGTNVEYQLSDRSKIGSSVISITPLKADEWLYGQIAPSSYLIWNVYNRTAFSPDTYVNAELAFSNRNVDSRNSLTSESDSAFTVSGRTRLWGCEINGAYRRNGLDFASLRKVRSGNGWREEKYDLSLKAPFKDIFTQQVGYESAINQEGNASSPEVNGKTIYCGLDYHQFDFWKIIYEYRDNTKEIKNTSISANQRSGLFYSSLDLCYLLPFVKSISKRSELIYKNRNIDEHGESSSGVIFAVETSLAQTEIGWHTNYYYGLSSYILLKNEKENDLLRYSSTTRDIPFYKIAYIYDFGGGHTLEISVDYSTTQQRGPTAYDKKEMRTGMSWNIPTDNPVLSSFQIGGTMKTTDYTDINDSLNNYKASEASFQATMAF